MKRRDLWWTLGLAVLVQGACSPPPPPPFNPKLEMSLDPGTVTAGQKVTLTFKATDLSTGKPVGDLDVSNESLLHIYVVSGDLQDFAHLHPEDAGPVSEQDKASGTLKVSYTFPRAGRYLVGAEGAHGCAHHVTGRYTVDVQGPNPFGAPTFSPELTQTVAGTTVKLTLTPTPPSASKENRLDYHLTRNGAPVTDLELLSGDELLVSYFREDLGAWGHEVPARPGQTAYAHAVCPTAHPLEHKGPEVPVFVKFAATGRYKLFAQFKRGGTVHTVGMWMRVEP